MSAILSIERLTKTYRLGTIGGFTLQQDLERWWARVRRQPDPLVKIGQQRRGRTAGELFWALDDVTFDVQEGEVLGVIGRNGAGKSTLLKILSEVTAPTSGQIALRGRVASLLEVGTGFHPDLTGRENIFLNGAILGMSKAEIRAQFDDIVGFSECEAFIDTPVKRYSSGMYVRLAFAVAAHLEQEILIIDEVLAVGDAQFQQKCLRKMEEVGRAGRTILFVSHQISSIQRLCNRAVLLENGRLVKAGDVSAVVERYLVGTSEGQAATRHITIGDDEARIVSWRLVNGPAGLDYCCHSRDVATFEIVIRSTRHIPYAHLGFVIRTMMGDRMISAQSVDGFQKRFAVHPGETRIHATVRLPLKTDRYRLDLTLADEQWHIWDQWLAEPLLTVLSSGHSVLPPERQGLIDEPVSFEVV
jgi:lipopolysaccharide transport system ATP-binding protein